MVVPQKHPKMIIFSRKTHGCWVPPFWETPHIFCACVGFSTWGTWWSLRWFLDPRNQVFQVMRIWSWPGSGFGPNWLFHLWRNSEVVAKPLEGWGYDIFNYEHHTFCKYTYICPGKKVYLYIYICVFWMVLTDLNLTLLRIYFTHVTWNAHLRIYSLIPRHAEESNMGGTCWLPGPETDPGSYPRQLGRPEGLSFGVWLESLTLELGSRMRAPSLIGGKTPAKKWHTFPGKLFFWLKFLWA